MPLLLARWPSLNGFKDALKAVGVELGSELIVNGEFRVDGGFAAMEKLHISGRPVSAVFFMNDEMAAGAIDMCMQNGISIPDQISILGCDDLNLAGFMHPKLTTLRQPLRELGNAACELAHAVATNSDTSNIKRVFQAEVVERASVIAVIL